MALEPTLDPKITPETTFPGNIVIHRRSVKEEEQKRVSFWNMIYIICIISTLILIYDLLFEL